MRTTIPAILWNMDPVSPYVRVSKVHAAVALPALCVGIIVGCAEVIREITTRSRKGGGRNECWIADKHVDLATKNDVSTQ